MQPNPRLFPPSLRRFLNQTLAYYSLPFIAFAVAPSVCVSAFLFAGEPRFGCIFGQQLTSAVALSNTPAISSFCTGS
jgi:hypothetical protein